MRRLLILPVIAALGLVAVPTGGGALGKYSPLAVTLASHVEPLTFTIEHTGGYDCEAGTITLESTEVDGTAVTPVSVTPDPANANAASVVLASDTAPGVLVVVSSCAVGSGNPVALGEDSFASLPITKVVSGTVPDATTFTVHVDCLLSRSGFGVAGALPTLALDLTYPATGGLRRVYFDTMAECEITEPDNGGAAATTISSPSVDVASDTAYPVTVTNDFPIEIAPNFTG